MTWENDTKRDVGCQGDSILTCGDKRGFDSYPGHSRAAFMMVKSPVLWRNPPIRSEPGPIRKAKSREAMT